MLKELNIIKDSEGKAGQIFEKLFPNFFDIKYKSPSDYVNFMWNEYKNYGESNSNLNGKFFELIIATLCVREKLLPLFLSAKVAFVPNVNYDLMFYTAERGPLCLSFKTSLRERYKQADLESIALKYVHRKALSFLVTLEEKEANKVKEKIKSGDVIGIDMAIIANKAEFDDLIKKLHNYKLELPPKVEVIQSNFMVTKEKVNNLRVKTSYAFKFINFNSNLYKFSFL